jgi:hypothetical protein
MFASGAVQGVADAGGARPIGTMNPITDSDASDTDTLRWIADNVTPFPGQDVALTPAVADVTIVVIGTVVVSDLLIGMHP